MRKRYTYCLSLIQCCLILFLFPKTSWSQSENPPILLTPFNNQVISSDAELRGTIFSWTSTSDQFSNNQIAIYPVFPCQDPLTAFRVNHPIYMQYTDNGFFSLSEDMELFDGKYVWSVSSGSSSYEQLWSPPSVFEISTGSGLFIEVDNPCDTPAGCLQIQKDLEKEHPISLGVSIADPDRFKYPRALPIRAEGLDYDKVTFKCPGCSAEEGKEIRYFQDGVSSFEWVLEGKGSLGDPFKQKNVDDLNKELDEKNKQIKDLQQELDEKQARVDSGIDQEKEENERQIEKLEKDKQRLDSLEQNTQEALDSIQKVQEDIARKLSEQRSKLQEKFDSLAAINERLDTLYSLLNDEYTNAELELLAQVRNYVDERKALEENMKQARLDYLNDLAQLDEAIDKAEDDIDAAIKAYQSAQAKIEVISQKITKLNSQLLSNQALFDYRQARDQWSLKLRTFHQLYAVKDFENLYLKTYQEAEKLSRSTSNRTQVYNQFLTELAALKKAVDDAARKAGSAEATEARGLLRSATTVFQASVDSLRNSSTVIDPQIQEDIETEQDKLAAIESSLGSSENQIEQAYASLDNAIKSYEDRVDEYETERSNNEQKLDELRGSIGRAQAAFDNRVNQRRKKTEENREEYKKEVSQKELNKIDVQADINEIYDKLISIKSDSSATAKERKFLEDDKRNIAQQKEKIDEEIESLKDQNRQLDEEKEELEGKLDDLRDELNDLIEERNELLGKLEAATAATKTAQGAIVYYIPPTLDELLKGTGAEAEFKKLVIAVEEKKDSLNQALAQKAGLQKEYTSMMVSVAKELIKLKENEATTEKLKEEQGEADSEAAEQKRDAGTRLREARDEEQAARDKLKNDKDKLDESITELEGEAKGAGEELNNYKELMRLNDSLLTDLRREYEDNLEKLADKSSEQRQRENNIGDNTAKLREKKSAESNIRQQQGRAQNDLSRASALDNIAGIASSRKELNRLETEMTKVQEDIRFYVQELGIMAADLKRIKEEIQELEKANVQNREKYHNIAAIQLERRTKLGELENNLEQADAELLQAKKDRKKLDQIKTDSSEQTANIDSLLEQDEAYVEAKKKSEEIAAKLKKLEKEKEQSKANIKSVVDKKKEAEEKAKDAVEKAEKSLQEARDELQKFIDEQFDKASFTTKLKIIAKDDVIDHWRTEDDPKEETVTLTYNYRVPSITDLNAGGNGSTIEEPSKCYPIIETDVMNPPQVAGLSAGNEPRTRALLYEDGKLLYGKWAVLPDDAPLLSKDVVIASAAVAPDLDEFNYQCISEGESPEEKAYRLDSEGNLAESATSTSETGGGEAPGADAGAADGGVDNGGTRTRDQTGDGTRTRDGENGEGSTTDGGEEEQEEDEDFCVSMAGLHDSIIDMGRYEFGGGVIVGPNSSNTLNLFLWEPAKVAKDKEKEKQMINAKYDADKIYEDDEVGGKGEFEVTAGVMIETSKDIKGSPGGKERIITRVVQGDHSGLEGEEIHLEVERTKGDAEKYGFVEGGSTSADKKTEGSGYLEETYFYFGEGYGEFEITVQWKRGGAVIQEEKIKATSPLIHQYQLMAYELNKKSLDEARKMVKNGTANVDAALGAIDTEDKQNWLVFGTLNFDNSFANGIELSFKSEGEAKVEPDKESTADFGIAMTALKDAPEDEQFEVTSTVPEKYEDFAEDYEAKGTVDTDKVKEFKIGSGQVPFVIVLDNEASPGSTISGDAHISIDAIPNDLPIKDALKKLAIKVEDVQVEKQGDAGSESFVATAGAVVYESAEGIKYTALSAFEINLTSFGVTASTGAKIKGEVNHEKLEDAVQFEAELEGNGDFLGKISNLPEIEVKKFKLKKGTSVVIDLHRQKSEAPFENDFQGLIIQQASLELPKDFNREGVDEPSTISVEDFYVNRRGFGGSIALKGQLLSMGYAGYELRLKELSMKFKDNALEEGSFAGEMVLPSPMEGEVGIGITLTDSEIAGKLSTDKPILLPQFKTTFVLKEAGVVFKAEENLGILTLSALINSEKHGDIDIDGFKLTSKGEVRAENISVEKDIEIGKGFKMNLRHLGFHFKDEKDYGMSFDGKVDFKGILAIDAKAEIKAGPTLSFEQLDIDFDKGPINFKGEFTYQQAVFEGEFDIKFKKFNKGLDGMIVVGNQPISKDESFSYWYGEIGAAWPIPIAQSGFSFLEFGGGVGYNYVPPIGNQSGSPLQDGGFSLKAKVGIGNAPNGELIAGRMEMSYVSGNISMYGKAWALSKEESLYGEGQINIRNMNTNPSVDGYIAAFVGLTDTEGKLFLARGKINFSYPSNRGRYVWSEQLNASLFQSINADAQLEIGEERMSMSGQLSYDVNKELSIGFGSLKASFDLDAQLGLVYVYKPPSGTAKPRLAGNWDVNVEAFDKSFDVLSGTVRIQDAELKIEGGTASVKGYADARYKVLWYQGSKSVRVDYSTPI